MIDQIICGDCLEEMKKLPDNSIDAIVTDPPYKLSQEYSQNTDADNLLAVSSILLSSKEMYRVAKPGSIAAVFYDTRILPLALYSFNKSGWKYVRALTFYRKWGSANKLHGWMSTSDFILIFAKPGAPCKFYGPWKHDVYVKEGGEREDFNHPAQKPLEFIEHLVQNITPMGGVCLDPYAGSGTTLSACINSNRHFIGIELSEEYCAIARKRIAAVPARLDRWAEGTP